MMIGVQRRRGQFRHVMARRKFVFVCAASLLCYFFLSPNDYDISFDGVIPGVEPIVVWEYLADFNNMKKLNPTIENFSITSDNGDYHKWEYGVYYTEHLSNLHFIKNSAHAHFKVYHEREPKDEYVIESDHKTCFIGKYLCVNSRSKFMCRQKDQKPRNTYCREDVTYECPRLASWFCHSEVMYQRKAIFRNLVLELLPSY